MVIYLLILYLLVVKKEYGGNVKTVGGHRVQRDLYSGFLLKHVSEDNRTIDRAGCNLGFEAFLQSQEQCMNDIRASGAGYPACFGF